MRKVPATAWLRKGITCAQCGQDHKATLKTSSVGTVVALMTEHCRMGGFLRPGASGGGRVQECRAGVWQRAGGIMEMVEGGDGGMCPRAPTWLGALRSPDHASRYP